MDVSGAKILGRAFNREMKRLMLNHAFRFVEKVIFYVGENNVRSQKAMEKIGAIRNGILRRAYGNHPAALNVKYVIKKLRQIERLGRSAGLLVIVIPTFSPSIAISFSVLKTVLALILTIVSLPFHFPFP